MQQSGSEGEEERIQRVRTVFEDIRTKSQLDPNLVKDLATKYFTFLKECGGKEAMKEFTQLDRAINGPASVAGGAQFLTKDAGLDVAQYHATQQAGTPVNGSQAAH